ncbi:putative 2-5A-dependent ribonuclease [Aspergillus terreus]|uniref:Putative 2-5A-dependent ribonuclease n=1 Tax=Aspergillus terreus TaxID=33178 RepID=A0A5M3ZDC3_ASPTE|nr:hypothetical protein ATETN484_0016016200 [Aspergillus terreus]GFF21591.1 putative 2-5A-dependent ribonuclease [Aspergillus terreus]
MDLFQRNQRLRKQLLAEVSKAIETPRAGPGRFAPRDRLRRIWTEDILRQFFRRETLLLARKTFVQDIRRDFVQTISILIYVNWDGWSRFDKIFFSHRGPDGRLDRTDRSIRHYDLQTLTSESFLGPVAGSHFFDNRHTFCPVDIEEDTDLCGEDGWRLPFLPAQSEPRKSGGFGHITKEVIAARHYHRKSGVCTTEVEVARKLFRSKLDYDRERINLKRLSESIAQHRHIVLPLATITIGHQFNILFPLAKMDLEDFLVGGRISPAQCSMDELLDEATHLADALDHLHNRLGVSTRGYHMDLKPANILVYEEPNPLRPHGIGKWKITDFGLSIIERPERRDSVEGFPQDPVTETITRLKGMEGTYQAPEVSDGGISRRSDVWSFGCILVRVFAFALDGIEGLHRLDRLRQKAEDGVGPYEHDYFARGNPPVLNPHIENWIRSLPHRRGAYNDEFLNGCARLLSSTLKINKNARPEAISVKEALGDLKFALHRPPRPSSSLSSISEHRSEGLESVQTPGSSVSAPLARTTSGLSLGLAILTDQLIDEIKRNDLSGIERVLGQNVQVDRPDKNGETPLGIATKLGNEAVVRRLLQANASVDTRSAGNKTPLMIAARNGHTQIAQLLLQRNPDLLAYSDEGLTCLHYATWANVSLELFGLLVSQFPFNVDIPTPEPEKETPLMMLIKHFVDHDSWEAKFKKLVGAGADVNWGAGFEMTPLRCAVSEGFIRAARLLIANHAKEEDFSKIPNMSHNMAALLEEGWGRRRRSGGRFRRRRNP